jgi:hypothetical protein
MKRLLVVLAFFALAGCSSGSNGSSSASSTTGKTTAGGSGSSGSSGTTGSGSSSGSTGASGSSGSTGSACAKHEGDSCATTTCCAGLACDPTSHFCQTQCAADAVGCRALFDACDTTHPCCGSATCRGGVCTSAAFPVCKHDGDACASASDCCGNADAGLQLSCIGAGDGGNVCHDPTQGERCGGAVGCSPGLSCSFGDGGADAGSCALPSGGRDGGSIACTGTSGACQLGDSCDPNLDYCGSGGLVCDPTRSVCGLPGLGAACTTSCAQTAGASQPVVCAANEFASGGLCQTGCGADSDCLFATVADTNSGLPVSQFCARSDPAGPAACQALVCYAPASGGSTGFGSTSDFYKPCAGHPDSLCVPTFQFGEQLGMCQAVRHAATLAVTTVGQVCSTQASGGLQDLLCGKDATCLGGRCAAICDVQQGGTGTLPGCSATQTCIATSQVDLTEAFQVGGCGIPCDPWTSDASKNGCPADFCNGPLSACEWIIGDRVGSRPLGYCRAETASPLHEGDDCKARPGDCATGLFCLSTNAARTAAACFRLCDATAAAGSPDACTAGKTCTAFNGFTHGGRCR